MSEGEPDHQGLPAAGQPEDEPVGDETPNQHDNDNNDNDGNNDNNDSVWEQQGYSPLVPMGGGNGGSNGTTVMATMNNIGTTTIMTTHHFGDEWGGFPSSDDDDEDSDNNGNRTNDNEAIGDEGGGGNNHDDKKTPSVDGGDLDFRSLADQALSQLDLDYQQTIANGASTAAATVAEPNTRNIDNVDDETENQPQQPIESTAASDNFANWDDMMAAVVADSSNPKPSEAVADTTSGEETKPRSSLPEIDSDAVRQAMLSLQQKQAPKFTKKLQQWETSNKTTSSSSSSSSPLSLSLEASHGLWAASLIVPHSHTCIPKTILRLYAGSKNHHAAAPNETEREDAVLALAKETQQLSRAATLVEALCRTDALRRQETLVIHLIGCDPQEQDDDNNDNKNTLPAFLSPVVQWLPRARQVPHKITFHLIGPGLQLPSNDGNNEEGATATTAKVITSLPAPITRVSVQHHSMLYHEFLQTQTLQQEHAEPDLVLSFHAGVWGYEDWRPTLKYLAERRKRTAATASEQPKKIPLVVTAYTLWEAQEDYEVMKEFFANDNTDKESRSVLWKPQLNPFGSHMERPTTTAPKEQKELYRENAAWQAWRF